MKAVVFEETGGPEVLKVKEVKKPEPSFNQVLIKLHVFGLNPHETLVRQGAWGKVKLPHILGIDGSGEVEKVGKDVKKFKAGDRVWVFHRFYNAAGTYAEYVAVAEDHVFHLPDKTSFKEGATLGLYLTASNALFHVAKARPGETVLIHGASGGVGVPAVQLAKAHGLKIIGTASTEDGQKIVKDNGADHVFNHRDKDYVQKIMEVTNNQGPDIIIEMVLNVNLKKDMEMIAKGGRIIPVGGGGSVEIESNLFLAKRITVAGVGIFTVPNDELQEDAALIAAGLEQGWLKPVIGREYPMEKTSDAHRDLADGKAKGKTVILVC